MSASGGDYLIGRMTISSDTTWPLVYQGLTYGEPSSPIQIVSPIYQPVEAEKKEEKHMRYLYRINVVDPKTEAVILMANAVAETEQNALLKAKLPDNVREAPDKYDILIERVGQVRAKRETQTVKVVTQEE